MPRFVIDTNLYVEADRDLTGRRTRTLLHSLSPILSISTRSWPKSYLPGAIDRRREKLVEESLIQPFERRRRVLTPSFAAWKAAGRIVPTSYSGS